MIFSYIASVVIVPIPGCSLTPSLLSALKTIKGKEKGTIKYLVVRMDFYITN